ncbi:DNA-binding protein, SET3 histone deacetylase complex subunit, putative [Candida maltosa Xu316]|uniref:DNA-binding protein, SET3 histone deacetylase complex subunit, putative n=1 Tax=Candida maltosa (strain Xu316) TaxID=1245528 RepID=M3K415_CANMX|nr:DNA-binding protein, SET3 histone deacetylase complex subunit, putative [Candida maltosa Xu316]
MSSSNPRGGNGSSRYNDYLDYGKSRRKNFYSSNLSSQSTSSLQGLSRRDFKSNGPGSSSLTHSKDQPPVPQRNGSYPSSSYNNNNSNNNYGNYHDYYIGGGRNDTWRKSSGSGAPSVSGAGAGPAPSSSAAVGGAAPDSRLSSSNLSSSSSNSSYSSSYQQYRSNNPNGDYRVKDRYDSYDGSINTAKWKSNRSSVGSRYSAKDRIRGKQSSLPYSSGSNSVPLGSSSLVNSTGYRGDSYYGRGNSYNSYSKPRDYKYKYGNRDYGRSTLIAPVDNELKKEYEDRDSPISKDDDDEEDEEEEEEDEEEEQDEEQVGTQDREREENHHEEKKKTEFKLQDESMDTTTTDVSKIEEVPEEKVIETPSEIPKPEVKVEYEPTPTSPTTTTTEESDKELFYKYPLPKIETEYEELQKSFKQDANGTLKYSLVHPATNIYHFPCYLSNMKLYQKIKKPLINKLQHKNNELSSKRRSLWKEYNRLQDIYYNESFKMQQQLRVLHPPDDEMRKEIDASDNRKVVQQTPEPVEPTSTRRNRRHGDLVTSEEEFKEILLALGKEQEDPLERANRLAATIPDMILDQDQLRMKYMDSNNVVKSKEKWAQRIHENFTDNFSAKEHELFTEAYVLHPKRFGAISRHMGGLRTASECVIHYYVTKKSVNYKQLLLQFRKSSNRKGKRTRKQQNANNNNSSKGPVEVPPVATVQETTTAPVSTEVTLPVSAVPAPVPVPVPNPVSSGGPLSVSALVSDTTAPTPDSVTTPNIPDQAATPISVPVSIQLPVSFNPSEPQPTSEELYTETGRRKRAAAPVFEGKQKKQKETTETTNSAKSISSYWSITEANAFPKLLEEFGMNWPAIADKLETKSATMVKNYFQRNAEKFASIGTHQKMSIRNLLN